jgi:hypothetical protein
MTSPAQADALGYCTLHLPWLHLPRLHLARPRLHLARLCLRWQIVEMKQQKNILNERRILDMMDHPFVLKLAGHYHDSAEVHTHAPYLHTHP